MFFNALSAIYSHKEGARLAISIIRTIILYCLLTLAMRLMGKRQLGELQPSELVVTLLISNLAAVPMQENSLPLFSGVLPILVLISLEIIVSCLILKFPLVARLVSGSPIPIIKDGQIDERMMRKLRITIDDLIEALRQQDIFDIRQVQYAIVETNGHISAFCYEQHQNATRGDVLPKAPSDNGMPAVIISDGKRSAWGLSLCGLDDKWLDRQLKKHKCDEKQVFLLTADKSGTVFLLKKSEVEKKTV